uniref:Uncharacterized protein n=1 Tax=Arundo donax TaxID=35708 RepID=A0A0A8Z818_ARUDO
MSISVMSVAQCAAAVNKPPHYTDQLVPCVAPRLHDEEAVLLPFKLDELHRLAQRLEPRDIVHDAVSQQVVLTDYNEHR